MNRQDEKKSNTKVGASKESSALKRPQKINLIDAKRGQNGAIALARIKLSYRMLRERCYFYFIGSNIFL